MEKHPMSLSKKVIEEDLEPNKEKECKLERQKVIKQTKSRNRKTVTPNSGYRKEYKNYADYLKSDKWKQVKEDYAKNEKVDNCICCNITFDSDIKPQHHHFRYPKDWNDDSWENLIVLCEGCHNLAHSAIEHNSNPITLRTYISLLFGIYTNYTVDERVDIENFLMADWLSGFNCDVISNREGRPYKIQCHDGFIMKNSNMAQKLLNIQRNKSKDV
jgi:5-methylcytosine-specific restriction endonuclease McrA